jgi:HD-GYP domain-containing protein (c-di-GMP phosphodiesterase class II)
VSIEAALEEINANAGRDFDPDLVRMFVGLVRTDPDLRSRLSELRRPE